MKLKIIIFNLILCLGALEVSAQSLSDWDTCYRPNYSNQLECATLTTGDGAELFVTKKRAVKLGDKPPLVILAGGPGQAAGEMLQFIDAALGDINQRHDLLFVDRRATGQSNAWQCEINEDAIELEEVLPELDACYNERKWPVEQLSSPQSVEDLEDLRRVLGVEKFHLWGGSWGTRFALQYATWYPESIDRMILDAVAPMDIRVLLSAQAAERSLNEIAARCLDQAACRNQFPDFRGSVTQLVNSMQAPVEVSVIDPITQEVVAETFDWKAVVQQLRGMLYMPEFAVRLPYIVEQANLGNWTPFATAATEANAMSEGMYMGLTLSVLCAEEVPYMSSESIQSDAADTFLGASWAEFWVESCGVWPTEQRALVEPIVLDHPTILISGDLDPITPPHYADHAMQYLPNAQHVIVENGGHINSMRGCLPEELGAFLEAEQDTVDTACLSHVGMPLFMIDQNGPSLIGGEQ